MKVKFTIKDRIVLPPILPSQGSYSDMIVRRDLIEKITLTQEELTEFEIKTEDNRITWNEEKQRDFEIDLTELEYTLTKEALEKLDTNKEITDDFVELYGKFCK